MAVVEGGGRGIHRLWLLQLDAPIVVDMISRSHLLLMLLLLLLLLLLLFLLLFLYLFL